MQESNSPYKLSNGYGNLTSKFGLQNQKIKITFGLLTMVILPNRKPPYFLPKTAVAVGIFIVHSFKLKGFF